MKEEIANIQTDALSAIETAAGEQELEEVRIAFLGKKGRLTAASAGMKDIDRLTLAKRQLERRVIGKRSTSSLPTAIDLLLSRPIVSAHMVAKAAKVTPRGALNLISELGVREITGRGRYRAWGIF